MHKIQGVKYEQLTEIIGVSENTLKVRMHRAIKKLKQIYFKSAE